MESLRSNKDITKLTGVKAVTDVKVPDMPMAQWTSMEELLEVYESVKAEAFYGVNELGGLISIKPSTNRGVEKSEKFTTDQAKKIASSVKAVLETEVDAGSLEFLRAACIGSNEAWILLQMSPDGKHYQSGALAGITALMTDKVESFPLAKVECIALFILACTLKPILKDIESFKKAAATEVCIPFTLKDRKWTLVSVPFKLAMVLSMCRAFRMATCRDFGSYRKLIIASPNENTVINPGDYKRRITQVISNAASNLK